MKKQYNSRSGLYGVLILLVGSVFQSLNQMKRHIFVLGSMIGLLLGSLVAPAASLSVGMGSTAVFFDSTGENRNYLYENRSVAIYSVVHAVWEATPGATPCIPYVTCDWEYQSLHYVGGGSWGPWNVYDIEEDYTLVHHAGIPYVYSYDVNIIYHIIRCVWDEGNPQGDKSLKGWPAPPTYPESILPSWATVTFVDGGNTYHANLKAPKGVTASDYCIGWSGGYFYAIPIQHFWGAVPSVHTLYGYEKRSF